MADIQHKDAQKLLGIISSAMAKGHLLTYREAADLLGRPSNHSRAVAQVCDLLDAAACLAGVPLVALVAVRADSQKINPKAWKEERGSRRDAIIHRSLVHKFGSSDFRQISRSLRDLRPRGNRKSWRYVRNLYPGELLFRRVTGDYQDNRSNAIDDLGTDVPDRQKSEVWTYARDQKVRETVLRRANGKCEFCREPGFLKPDGEPYLESHHVIALANDGEDRLTNVIALCPYDHREAHFGKRAKEIERKMIQILKRLNG